MKRFLITGFEAFGDDLLNPTELLMKWISEDPNLSADFVTQVLPVEYEKAHTLILQRPDLDSFDSIFCFGLAGGRSKIGLERVALNWIESSQADNAGKMLPLGPIDEKTKEVFFNEMNLEPLRASLQKAQLPVEISLSAGGYVCNYLYFQLLKASLKAQVLFIHIPYLKEQVADKPIGTAFLSEADLRRMLAVLVQCLRAN